MSTKKAAGAKKPAGKKAATKKAPRKRVKAGGPDLGPVLAIRREEKIRARKGSPALPPPRRSPAASATAPGPDAEARASCD
jgi:hypothetical protein